MAKSVSWNEFINTIQSRMNDLESRIKALRADLFNSSFTELKNRVETEKKILIRINSIFDSVVSKLKKSTNSRTLRILSNMFTRGNDKLSHTWYWDHLNSFAGAYKVQDIKQLHSFAIQIHSDRDALNDELVELESIGKEENIVDELNAIRSLIKELLPCEI